MIAPGAAGLTTHVYKLGVALEYHFWSQPQFFWSGLGGGAARWRGCSDKRVRNAGGNIN